MTVEILTENAMNCECLCARILFSLELALAIILTSVYPFLFLYFCVGLSKEFESDVPCEKLRNCSSAVPMKIFLRQLQYTSWKKNEKYIDF